MGGGGLGSGVTRITVRVVRRSLGGKKTLEFFFGTFYSISHEIPSNLRQIKVQTQCPQVVDIMSKRMESILDLGLPQPPPADNFMQCMKKNIADKAPTPEDGLFDAGFQKEVYSKGTPCATRNYSMQWEFFPRISQTCFCSCRTCLRRDGACAADFPRLLAHIRGR